jgi:hypothetical protein
MNVGLSHGSNESCVVSCSLPLTGFGVRQVYCKFIW